MADLPVGFIDIVSSSSIEQCKSMLVHLNNTIIELNDKVCDSKSIFNDYTEHTSNFLKDSQLKETIIAEVTSLGILKKKTNKVTTQWLSPDGDDREYCFSESQKFRHPPNHCLNTQVLVNSWS